VTAAIKFFRISGNPEIRRPHFSGFPEIRKMVQYSQQAALRRKIVSKHISKPAKERKCDENSPYRVTNSAKPLVQTGAHM
jgi:hypothetical protein